jgi:hypothetical protein
MAAARRWLRRGVCPAAPGPQCIPAGGRSGLGKCLAAATCVHGRAPGEPLPDRHGCRNARAGPWTTQALRGTPAGRTRELRKKICCVTTRHGNFWLFQHLRRRRDTPAARTLSLGMLGLDPFVLSTPRLPPRRLPAADLAQALRILAVTLVPTPGLILAPTAFAQTHPRPRSPRTGTWAASWITMMTTHGRSLSPKGQPEGNARTFSSGAFNH